MRLLQRLCGCLLILPVLLRVPSLHAAPATEDNLLALGAGARVVQAPPSYGNWEAYQLLDERPDSGWAPVEKGARGPFAFLFELAGRSEIRALGFNNRNVDGDQRDARGVSVEIADAAKGPWQPLWSGKLKPRSDGQRYVVTAKSGRYLRLTIQDNQGDADWTELMDVAAYGKALAPIPVPPVTGAYESPYGTFRIAQDGISAEGCYEYDFGRIENGGFEGRVLRFTWSEKNQDGSFKSRGPALFIFADDGKSYEGYWWKEGQAQGAPEGLWNGKRSSNTPGSCPHWQPKPKSAGAELAKQLKQEGRVRLYGILFDTDSDLIRSESKPTLDALIAAAKSDAAMKLLIEGHTDSTGGTAHNADLSARRAASVKAALVAGGIEAGRLGTRGFGSSQPVASNDTSVGRSQNRRVEVVRQ